MPGYKGHLIAGSLLYAFSVWQFNLLSKDIVLLLTWFVCTLAGSLFPDIDTKSKGQQIFYLLFSVLLASSIVLKKYTLGAWAGLIGFLPLLSRHRGLFHSSFFLIFLIILVCHHLTLVLPGYKTLVFSATYFFALGVLSHLLCDFGPSGIKNLLKKLRQKFSTN